MGAAFGPPPSPFRGRAGAASCFAWPAASLTESVGEVPDEDPRPHDRAATRATNVVGNSCGAPRCGLARLDNVDREVPELAVPERVAQGLGVSTVDDDRGSRLLRRRGERLGTQLRRHPSALARRANSAARSSRTGRRPRRRRLSRRATRHAGAAVRGAERSPGTASVIRKTGSPIARSECIGMSAIAEGATEARAPRATKLQKGLHRACRIRTTTPAIARMQPTKSKLPVPATWWRGLGSPLVDQRQRFRPRRVFAATVVTVPTIPSAGAALTWW